MSALPQKDNGCPKKECFDGFSRQSPVGAQLSGAAPEVELRRLGRGSLLALIEQLREDLRKKTDEARHLTDNVTATQVRCSDLLKELRHYRDSGICLPGWWCWPCGAFNGAAMGRRERCRRCDAPAPERA